MMDMTMINTLKENVKEELNDCMKYAELAEMARDRGIPNESQMFRDMAKEEYSHAGHNNHILKEHGSNTNEYHDMWVKAEKAVYGL